MYVDEENVCTRIRISRKQPEREREREREREVDERANIRTLRLNRLD
jgi:hypothetical protein